jgi:hypothetical protein
LTSLVHLRRLGPARNGWYARMAVVQPQRLNF